MAKTRIQKIEDIDAQVAQMLNERKLLLQAQKEADRKARDHRIIKRGAFIESVLPDVVPFTDEQFKAFVMKTLTTDFAKKVLAQIAAQPSETPTEKIGTISPVAEMPTNQRVAANAAVANSNVPK